MSSLNSIIKSQKTFGAKIPLFKVDMLKYLVAKCHNMYNLEPDTSVKRESRVKQMLNFLKINVRESKKWYKNIYKYKG